MYNENKRPRVRGEYSAVFNTVKSVTRDDKGGVFKEIQLKVV